MSQPHHVGRKRSRSKCDDGVCDFTPLSKRINNLHLDRPDVAGHGPVFGQPFSDGLNLEAGSFDLQPQWGAAGLPNNQYCSEPRAPATQTSLGPTAGSSGRQEPSEPCTSPWISDSSVPLQYEPVLDSSENPHYYESNKLLFQLFMERLQRLPHL